MFALKDPALIQSTLHPAGAAAELTYVLAMWLFFGASALFVLVIGLALYGACSRPRPVRPLYWIVGGGLALPILVLTGLLVYGFALGNALPKASQPGSSLHVQVTGKQWWWDVRYRASQEGAEIVLANELHLPLGRPVPLSLRSADVIHSFWIPALAGKLDMIPGRTNRLTLVATRTGVFRGQCAEYCGSQHALMAFYVIAHSPAAFERWLRHQATPALEPADPFLLRGRAAFFTSGCAMCHTIRGTNAAGQAGPDLTHVGSRRTLAAGTLDNHIGTMAGWVADSQRIKPGSFMPPTNTLSGLDLRAVSAYLVSLK